jgi:hypothetical protein
MSDAADIETVVKGDGTLTTLIAGRIFPLVLPSLPQLPALTYQLVSQPTDRTQDRAFYRWPRWRFRIVCDRYFDLDPIAAALSAIFEDPSRSPFRSSWIDGTVEDREPDTGRFWRLVDVLGFQPAGPTQ